MHNVPPMKQRNTITKNKRKRVVMAGEIGRLDGNQRVQVLAKTIIRMAQQSPGILAMGLPGRTHSKAEVCNIDGGASDILSLGSL